MTLDTRSYQAIRTISPLLLGLTLLTGCVPKVALTKPARESIQSVSINKDVKLPNDMVYQGLGQDMGAAFGLIGIMVAQAAAQGSKAQLEAAMRENQIDLGQIIQEQLAAKLVEAGICRVS